MKVFVTGATGVLGNFAVKALLADGHEVIGLARCDENARALAAAGVTPASAHLFDVHGLTSAIDGCNAVCNLATHVPVGMTALRPGAWRVNDRLRTEGSKAVAAAATAAGVRRLVQESVSFMYADGGEEWISEDGPLSVTRAVEPAAVAEANAASFECRSRQPVVLRFGQFVGDDPTTRWTLGRAKAGHPVGLGAAASWGHVVHPEDAGAAVAAALEAPGGVYNVGAAPVRRGEMMQVIAQAVERDDVGFVPPLLVKLAGERVEPLTRSHRVSSAKLHEATGWKPIREVFDQSWLTAAATR